MCQSLLFNKDAGLSKEALAQVFSCEFCENFKNTFSYRTHPVAASIERNYGKGKQAKTSNISETKDVRELS